MSKHNRSLLLAALAAVLLAHAALWLGLPYTLQAIAVFVLAGVVPAILLVEALVGRSDAPPTLWERLVYIAGVAPAVVVVVLLLLSYLPGPLPAWQPLLGFDLLTLLLALWLIWQERHVERRPAAAVFADAGAPEVDPRLFWAGALLLLGIGTFFRFANLGYAEYQGDEARAALRAAAVIQGYDDVLLIHKKGPLEILLPAAPYAVTGHLTETVARLPFAVANLAALFAVWLLGWRLLNPLAGWIAALFLALDGYFIGFARIVQYQSVVFLVSALVVLILHRLLRQPQAAARYLTLVALLLATGLLSHYEGALAALPAAYLFGVLLWRGRGRRAALLIAAVPGLLTGALLLALFYVPFVLHPNFAATYTYLTARRIGGSFPYNNLADFFLRTTVYSTSYIVLLLIGLTVAALGLAYGRSLGRRWGWGAAGGTAILLLLTVRNPAWLTAGGNDLIVLPIALLLLGPLFLPRLSVEERTLWLWFSVVMLLALFFTEKPRTHVYTFFTPWLLLAAGALAAGWQRLAAQIGRTSALAAGALAALLLIGLAANYAYWMFIHHRTEVLRTWQTWHPPGYWLPYDEPDDRALFGFPLANGWKVVGSLYAAGILEGDFETNEKEAWVPAWYTRGQERCGRTADWFFEIDNLEPWNDGDQKQMEHFLRQGFTKWGVVENEGAPRLVIYRRTGEQIDMPNLAPMNELPHFSLDEHAPAFDAVARADLPLTYPTIASAIGYPLRINFGNEIWLEGYDIDYPKPLRQGDTIRLTLYWRSQKPIDKSYKVFNQAYFGDGVIVAQRDGYPVCETRETWRWDPGELITDVYEIPVNLDAPDGLYPLYTGLYLEETFERLPVLDDAGTEVGSQVHLTDIRIGEE